MRKKALFVMTIIAMAMPAFAELESKIPVKFRGCWVHKLRMDWGKSDYYFFVSSDEIETELDSRITMEVLLTKQTNDEHLVFVAKRKRCKYDDCRTYTTDEGAYYGELMLKNGKLIYKEESGDRLLNDTYSRCSAK